MGRGGACFHLEEPGVNKEHNYVWCLNTGLNLQWYLDNSLHGMACFLVKNSSSATES